MQALKWRLIMKLHLLSAVQVQMILALPIQLMKMKKTWKILIHMMILMMTAIRMIMILMMILIRMIMILMK